MSETALEIQSSIPPAAMRAINAHFDSLTVEFLHIPAEVCAAWNQEQAEREQLKHWDDQSSVPRCDYLD